MAMFSLLRSGSPGARNDGAFATSRKTSPFSLIYTSTLVTALATIDAGLPLSHAWESTALGAGSMSDPLRGSSSSSCTQGCWQLPLATEPCGFPAGEEQGEAGGYAFLVE